jgi:HTH-type transcriptional regulator / antitoxin HigA
MEIRPIHTAEDHAAAVRRIEALWGAEPDTPEEDELDVLATLVDAYEAQHFPIENLDPIDTIKAHMDMAGYRQSDLASLFGSRSRASEIMNRRRPLNLQQVHALVQAWRIPAALLISPYQIVKAA